MLEFHTPASGDWLVIIDTQTGETVYEGHGGAAIYYVLQHFNILYTQQEHSDDIFEEKFC